MTVVRAEFKADGRSFKETFSGSWIQIVTKNTKGISVERYPITSISGSVTYIALSNDPKDTAIEVMRSSLLPVLGHNFVDERGQPWIGLYFKDRQPRFIGARGAYWAWEITYTVEGNTSSASDTDDTVILDFDASVETKDVAVSADLDGVHNCNSLGFYFDDPLIYKQGILNMTFKRREYANPIKRLMALYNCVNLTELWGFPPGSVKFSDMSYTSTVTESETSWDVTYKLQYNPSSWLITKANSSYYVRGANGLTRALNEDGSPAETPVLIDVNGNQLPTGTAPPMRSFRMYPLVDLNVLNLPDPRYL